MRYLIETTDPEQAKVIGSKLALWKKKNIINIIEKGDPIEALKTRLLRIQRAFDILKKSGIDEKIMIGYIHSKGVNKTHIQEVLHHQKDFFKRLGLEV